jgi:hypothetical protein
MSVVVSRAESYGVVAAICRSQDGAYMHGSFGTSMSWDVDPTTLEAITYLHVMKRTLYCC